MSVQTVNKKPDLYISIFFVYILINPLLDLASGFFMDVMKIQSSITPSLLVRMGFLLFMLIFLLKNKDAVNIKYLVVMFVLWAAGVAGEFMFSAYRDLFIDMQYFARFVYNLVIIFAYEIVFNMSEKQNINWKRYLINSLLFVASVSALTIVVSFIMKFGLATYKDMSGNKGYFHSGNDVTAVFISLFPITIYAFLVMDGELKKYEKILKYAAPILTADALLLIGTKSAFIAVIFNVIAILVYVFIKESKTERRKMLYLMGLIALSYALLFALPSSSGFIHNSYERQSDILENKDGDITGFVLSNRNLKAAQTFDQYKNANLYVKLFGLSRGSQEKIIEMDFLEIFFYYGIIGFFVFIYAYCKRGFRFMVFGFRNMSLEVFCLFCSLGLVVALSFLAGHVLFSATSGIYLSLLLAYANMKADHATA